jgi:hypothetical protein
MIKEVRAKLSGHAAECFAKAKVAAEKELGFALRDNEFAARVITNVVCNLPVRANDRPVISGIDKVVTAEESQAITDEFKGE